MIGALMNRFVVHQVAWGRRGGWVDRDIGEGSKVRGRGG